MELPSGGINPIPGAGALEGAEGIATSLARMAELAQDENAHPQVPARPIV